MVLINLKMYKTYKQYYNLVMITSLNNNYKRLMIQALKMYLIFINNDAFIKID